MRRNPTRPLRVLDVPLFRGADIDVDKYDYRAQDFYVFVGEFLNMSQEWVIPMMAQGGTIDAHRSTLSLYGASLQYLYWRFARNHFFEKSHRLDEFGNTWRLPCEPAWQVIEEDDSSYALAYQGGNQFDSFSMDSFSSKARKITFGPAYHGASFVIEAIGDSPWTMTTVYPAIGSGGGCSAGVESQSKKVVQVSPSSDIFYVLAAATEVDGQVQITVRPTTTSVTLFHDDGEERVGGREADIIGEYEAETGPVEATWFVDGHPVETQIYSEAAGTLRYPYLDYCSTGSTTVSVEIEDGDGARASDSVELQIEMGNSRLGIAIGEGYRCGASYELPFENGTLPAVTATGFLRGCDQGLSS